ncbi:hypothetical protein LG696_002104 [Salmonella enterica]|nr:hypothetical protein [Salmonella enterica]EII2626412.1 hypothetical protein [Salmonella enterica]
MEKEQTAPSVTEYHIENIIMSEHYFTAADGRAGALANGAYQGHERPMPEDDDIKQLGLLTFCVLVLANGFTVTGESACVSAENFNPELGCKYAREKALNKIWEFEGYLLKQELSGIDHELFTE